MLHNTVLLVVLVSVVLCFVEIIICIYISHVMLCSYGAPCRFVFVGS